MSCTFNIMESCQWKDVLDDFLFFWSVNKKRVSSFMIRWNKIYCILIYSPWIFFLITNVNHQISNISITSYPAKVHEYDCMKPSAVTEWPYYKHIAHIQVHRNSLPHVIRQSSGHKSSLSFKITVSLDNWKGRYVRVEVLSNSINIHSPFVAFLIPDQVCQEELPNTAFLGAKVKGWFTLPGTSQMKKIE